MLRVCALCVVNGSSFMPAYMYRCRATWKSERNNLKYGARIYECCPDVCDTVKSKKDMGGDTTMGDATMRATPGGNGVDKI